MRAALEWRSRQCLKTRGTTPPARTLLLAVGPNPPSLATSDRSLPHLYNSHLFFPLCVLLHQQEMINLRLFPEVILVISSGEGNFKTSSFGYLFLLSNEIFPDIKMLCLCSAPPNSQARKAHTTYFPSYALNNWQNTLKTGNADYGGSGAFSQYTPSSLLNFEACKCLYI